MKTPVASAKPLKSLVETRMKAVSNDARFRCVCQNCLPALLGTLNIVIVHCHFERGGVTQVVENHVRWLADQEEIDRIVLLSGHRVAGLSDVTRNATESVTLPDFDYDSANGADASLELEERVNELVRQWDTQMRALQISPAETVIHWHNHSLGKNVAAPGVIQRLASAGWRLLLQIHDFAEDNRPENYAHLVRGTKVKTSSELDALLYPVVDQIHYATLTRFDADLLAQIGIPAAQTHWLPNSVTAASSARPERQPALQKVRRAMGLPNDANWCLYPVRGIRRKNVGEFLMVSRMMPADCYSGLTLCPTTAVEKRSYDRWREAAKQLAPRSVFDAAHHEDISFADNLAASRLILSTSVAEGFGMAFLEPWLSHREVVARRLETVAADFERSDVRLPKLYDSLPIPGSASWIEQCQKESDAMLHCSWQSVPESFRPAIERATCPEESAVDFARLTPARQLEVLHRVASDPGFDAAVRERSSPLIDWLHRDADDDLILHNAATIRQQYSLGATGQRLCQIYGELLAGVTHSTCASPPNAGRALQCIHSARPFYPCRMEQFDD